MYYVRSHEPSGAATIPPVTEQPLDKVASKEPKPSGTLTDLLDTNPTETSAELLEPKEPPVQQPKPAQQQAEEYRADLRFEINRARVEQLDKTGKVTTRTKRIFSMDIGSRLLKNTDMVLKDAKITLIGSHIILFEFLLESQTVAIPGSELLQTPRSKVTSALMYVNGMNDYSVETTTSLIDISFENQANHAKLWKLDDCDTLNDCKI